MNLLNFWAKTTPFQSVYTHGVVSGIVGKTLFLEYFPEGIRSYLTDQTDADQERLVSFLSYLISLHDIGKLTYQFQSADAVLVPAMDAAGLKPSVTLNCPYRHEKTSAGIMRSIWTSDSIDERLFGDYAELIAAHHQGKTGEAAPLSGSWRRYHQEYEKAMRTVFLAGQKPVFPTIKRENRGAVQAVLLGLLILSDWISSSDSFADAESWRKEGTLEETAASTTRRFLEISGMQNHGAIPSETFCRTWQSIPKGGERELQKQTETLFSDEKRFLLALIEAPMGEGKTEAGIFAALRMAKQWEKHGFYVALPTSATSNQMVGRVRKLLQEHHLGDAVRLMHAMAWMFDSGFSMSSKIRDGEESESIKSWTVPKRRSLLVPYAVGTVDQAMMAAMFIKYGVLRLIGLSGKVLIIDEVHAYDTYMTTILKELLVWCKALRIPVVLLSATLPLQKKRELLSVYGGSIDDDSYPAITAVDEFGGARVIPVSKTTKRQTFAIEVIPDLNHPERIAELAVNRTAEGGCTCVLMNTVRQAQEVYSVVKRKGFDGDLLLFHSLFLACDRDKIEKNCLRRFGKDKKHRPKKAILIATQVVEQSLDVDFDFMISAVAPIDLLLQRMGRVHRHSETIRPASMSTPRIAVLIPGTEPFGNDGFVYPECLLRQTARLLSERNSIHVPEDVQELVQHGYSEEYVPQEELNQWAAHLMDETLRASSAQMYLLGPPEKKFAALHRQDGFDDLESNSYLSAKTRLSEPSVRVALLNDDWYAKLSEPAFDFKTISRKTAMYIMAHSVSLTEKSVRMNLKHEVPRLVGKGLLSGVIMLPAENTCLAADNELGVIWKEE